MTPTPSDALHPATVAAAVFTALLGPEFAQELAASTIILVGWFGGVLWGLARMPDAPPWAGWRVRLAFVLGTFTASMLCTVALASAIAGASAAWVPGMTRADVKDFLFPVAAAIPAIGHNWPDLLRWLGRIARLRISAWASSSKEPPK